MSEKLDRLIQKLNTSRDTLADKVIAEIAAQHGSAALPKLIAAAQNLEKPLIRKWSFDALGVIGDKKAAPILMKALDDERMTVRFHSLRGLSNMKFRPGAKKIAKLLEDESGGVRVSALYTLMAVGHPGAAAKIQKRLEDVQWYVRQGACKACGHFKLKASLPKLRKLAKSDERKAVREAAKLALEQLS